MLPRLLVVDPAVFEPEHESVARVLDGWRGASTVLRPALEDRSALASTGDVDGVVILGAHVSVHDNLPWLDDLAHWLEPILRGERSIPLLGICFAHQLIAHLTGGTVGYLRTDHTMYSDVTETHFEESRLLGGSGTMKVVAVQRYEVKSVGPAYRTTARRATCLIDAMEHRELPIFSVQFHCDANSAFARRNEVPVELIDEQTLGDGERILSAFRSLVWQRAQSAGG